jgi:transcriptional regulator with XRE-family HTH domain
MKDIADIFSSNLKRLRGAKDLTQDALAERAKISLSTVQGYESGRRWPEKVFLDAIIKALECHPSELFLDPELLQRQEKAIRDLTQKLLGGGLKKNMIRGKMPRRA